MNSFLKGALQIAGLMLAFYFVCIASLEMGLLLFLLVTLTCLVAIINPLPKLLLPTRRFTLSTLLIFATFGLSVISSAVSVRLQEEELTRENTLATLKASDPEAYLAELEQGNDRPRWFRELKELAPERYDDAIAKAAAEGRERGKQAAAEFAAERAAATAKQQQETKDRKHGFHCLSTWDGSHPAIKEAVKSALRAPESFEHVETATYPVDSVGRNKIIMTYRGQNGFGGITVERAVGSFDNTTCNARVEMIE